jgi:hypothetical protein
MWGILRRRGPLLLKCLCVYCENNKCVKAGPKFSAIAVGLCGKRAVSTAKTSLTINRTPCTLAMFVRVNFWTDYHKIWYRRGLLKFPDTLNLVKLRTVTNTLQRDLTHIYTGIWSLTREIVISERKMFINEFIDRVKRFILSTILAKVFYLVLYQ